MGLLFHINGIHFPGYLSPTHGVTFEQLSQMGATAPSSFACFDDGEPLHCTGRTDAMVACYDGKRAAYGRQAPAERAEFGSLL